MSFTGACAPLLLLVCSVSLWHVTSCGPPPGKLYGTAGGAADDPSWSPLTVAHCRATCLKEFSVDLQRDASCMQHPDCYLCWHDCEMLHGNWTFWMKRCEMSTCFPGCRTACRFFESEGSAYKKRQVMPVRETSAADLLVVVGLELRWPRPPKAAPAPGEAADAGRLVYVVMWRPNDTARWAQVTQTLERRARLPLPPGSPPPRQTAAAGSARVLVVDPGGLRTVYTPSDRQTAAAAAAALGGARAAALPPGLAAPAEWILPEEQQGGVWSVRVQSLIHQGVLVIAELSWRTPHHHQQASTSHQFLVTWEVDGGGITGNLYTDSTCVTLTLWPDTVFHIQVELVSRSESLQGVVGPVVGAALKAVVALSALFFCYRGSFLRRHHHQPEKAALIVDFEDEPCRKDYALNPVWTCPEKQAAPPEEKCSNLNV